MRSKLIVEFFFREHSDLHMDVMSLTVLLLDGSVSAFVQGKQTRQASKFVEEGNVEILSPAPSFSRPLALVPQHSHYQDLLVMKAEIHVYATY